MNEKMIAATKAMEDIVAQTKQNLEGLVKAQQEQVEKASAQILKSYDDLATLAKDNVDALVKSGTIVAKGAEEAGKQVAAFGQASVESSVANGKALLAVKTLNELVELQNAFMKQSFDAMVAQSGKFQELSLKIVNEAAAPINERVNATVEKLAKPIAA